ncbi:hypothetical protein DNK47_00450 [Mycoplasma wenyonii]|uniref:Uncharacterized protein n=1 Tax=Mycoplasma wenyonii TaxID=65123 RepID=A0A328PQ72_9MOLU|nr:hypothetical protein [Mycoplasma wenyonii]RAO95316.1 hypothetical protein DNK47_00450 [Mycoplasma wenyonii]
MSNFKTYWTKLKNFISRFCKSYLEWLHRQREQRHVKFVKKRTKLDCKIKNLDRKLGLYLKKTEAKKQKLQEKLNKVNKKLEKLDKALSNELEVFETKTEEENPNF